MKLKERIVKRLESLNLKDLKSINTYLGNLAENEDEEDDPTSFFTNQLQMTKEKVLSGNESKKIRQDLQDLSQDFGKFCDFLL